MAVLWSCLNNITTVERDLRSCSLPAFPPFYRCADQGQGELRALAAGTNPRARNCLHLASCGWAPRSPGGCGSPSHPSTPAGAQMQLSSGWRHLAELQMLVLRDVELEFVFLKELA